MSNLVKNAFGVDDELGHGGAGLDGSASAPNTRMPGSSFSPNGLVLKDYLRNILGTIFAPYASSAALTASLAANRADGQIAVKLDDYSIWQWRAGSSAAAGTFVIQPSDTSGNGRWVAIVEGTAPGTEQAGTSVLVNGVSAAIPATITANSRIFLTVKDIGASSATARLEAHSADRVVGAPGSFIVHSARTTGATETGDQSTFDWNVIG